ncbi:MAG: choice-of-anchor Q domain-containing protein [Thermoanaerobaculia bacterium]
MRRKSSAEAYYHPARMLTRGVLLIALLAGSFSAVSVHAFDIAVTTTGDSVDGDVSSVQALMARPGADGLSIREAVVAAAHTDGHHRIVFSPELDGRTIALTEPLYVRGNRTELIGSLDGGGRPTVTIDGTAIVTPGCCRALVFILASSCRVSRLRFTGVSNHAIEVRAGTWPYNPSAPSHIHDVLIDENEFDGSGGLDGAFPSAVRIWPSGATPGVDVIERVSVVRNVIRNYSDVGIIANTWGTGARITDLLIAGNRISDTPFPIEVAAASGASDSRIERTRIVDNHITNSTVAILIGSITGGAPVLNNSMSDTVISRNTIAGELDSIDVAGGIAENPDWVASGNTVIDTEISNNLVVSGRGVTILGGLGQGSRANRVEGVMIANNTIVTRPLSPVTALPNRDGASDNLLAGVTVVNTIAVRPAGGPDSDLAGDLRSTDVSHTLTTDGTFAGVNGNLAGDPGFMDGSYWIGAGSSAVDRGTSHNAPLFDSECRSRVGATDIGAFEHAAAPVARLRIVTHGRGTVSRNPEGSDCTDTAGFVPGTVVTLVAEASGGARFVAWSGAADCADGTVTMTTDIQCVASFHDFPARRRTVRR